MRSRRDDTADKPGLGTERMEVADYLGQNMRETAVIQGLFRMCCRREWVLVVGYLQKPGG